MTPNGSYKLLLAPRAINQIRSLLQKAISAGVPGRVQAALVTIHAKLRTNPTAWGDPRRHLPDARMTLYHRLHDELSVTYGVHEASHQVWLFRVVPVLTHPLGPAQPDAG